MNIKIYMLLAATALGYSSAAVAVEPGVYTTDSGIVITPLLNAGYKYDNNILNQGSNTQESGIFTLAPTVTFLLDDGINNYQVDIGVEWDMFMDSSADNSYAGNIHFNSHLEPSSQSRFDVKLEANKEVERRGTGISEGNGGDFFEPLSYNEQLAQLTYEYGSLASSARVAFMGSFYSKDYTNFEATTQFRNLNRPTLASTFFYSTNANTDAFFEIKASAVKYDINQDASRDSDVYTALIGIKWEGSALTTGSFKIGQERKIFLDDSRESFKGMSWEGNVDWKPLTYTTLSLETSRKAKDPDVQGDYIQESVYGVNWAHEWNEKVSSTMNFSYMNEDYAGSEAGSERVDKSLNLHADVSYRFKRWVDVALYIQYTDKDSTSENIVYNKSIVGLDFIYSL
jgi:hypothetical protein